MEREAEEVEKEKWEDVCDALGVGYVCARRQCTMSACEKEESAVCTKRCASCGFVCRNSSIRLSWAPMLACILSVPLFSSTDDGSVLRDYCERKWRSAASCGEQHPASSLAQPAKLMTVVVCINASLARIVVVLLLPLPSSLTRDNAAFAFTRISVHTAFAPSLFERRQADDAQWSPRYF